MVFQKKLSEPEDIFDSYLEHLSSGLPPTSWTYVHKSKDLLVTATSLIRCIGQDNYDDRAVDVAKARGIAARRNRLMELLEDPKTAIPKLAVLKAEQEIFFAEQLSEHEEESLLFNKIDDIINKELPNDQ